MYLSGFVVGSVSPFVKRNNKVFEGKIINRFDKNVNFQRLNIPCLRCILGCLKNSYAREVKVNDTRGTYANNDTLIKQR